MMNGTGLANEKEEHGEEELAQLARQYSKPPAARESGHGREHGSVATEAAGTGGDERRRGRAKGRRNGAWCCFKPAAAHDDGSASGSGATLGVAGGEAQPAAALAESAGSAPGAAGKSAQEP